ncbi:MAG: cell division protein FtsL [Paracoccaceae bacterium]|nr:cell division protein FtsL [Loktanella sp.]
MRSLMVILAALGVMGLGFWAYQENYKTQASMREVRSLNRSIGAAHETLVFLRAEWAYLNRPDRLADLAALNFERLELLPLRPESFGRVDQIIYPIPEILPITNPIDVTSVEITDEDPL